MNKETLRKKKILVIDDSEVNNILVKSIFMEKDQFDILVEADSNNAWKTIQHEKPDLILLDLMMPGVDGITILKNIRMYHETRHIPVVVISAKSESSESDSLKKLSIVKYIQKPYDLNFIHALAEQILGK
ncbi:MAG: response regulator [Bacteroidales bacterium]